MSTSNEEVAAIMQSTFDQTLASDTPYLSNYTGSEIDEGISMSRNIKSYIGTTVSVPPALFTGDFLQTPIVTLSESVWIRSITIRCEKPFSESSVNNQYEISTSTGSQLIAIPKELISTEGLEIEYVINQVYGPDISIDMVCTDTNAYGILTVKLNIG